MVVSNEDRFTPPPTTAASSHDILQPKTTSRAKRSFFHPNLTNLFGNLGFSHNAINQIFGNMPSFNPFAMPIPTDDFTDKMPKNIFGPSGLFGFGPFGDSNNHYKEIHHYDNNADKNPHFDPYPGEDNEIAHPKEASNEIQDNDESLRGIFLHNFLNVSYWSVYAAEHGI